MQNGNCKSANVLAIAGCTNTGKTTIADRVQKILSKEGEKSVHIIHQDDFYLEKEFVETIPRPESSDPPFYYDYDSTSSVDRQLFVDAVEKSRRENDYVIIEGNMLTEFEEILTHCYQILFLSIDKKTCLRRRLTRSYEPPDVDGYFDEIAWPAYIQHQKKVFEMARTDSRFSFLDVSSESDEATEENLMQLIQEFTTDIVRISSGRLAVEEVTRLVTSSSCGGISIFLGTTRNHFEGKKVLRLEYECYDEMAYKELRKLCFLVRQKYPSIEKIVIMHRVGLVPVEEASVIVATSSPHRKEAIEATELAIDELKRSVPIWKKEVYENGDCSWKANSECCMGGNKHHDSKLPDRFLDPNPKIFWLRK